jgi:hypothetical protein
MTFGVSEVTSPFYEGYDAVPVRFEVRPDPVRGTRYSG